MPDLTAFFQVASADPFFFYTLVAAIFLAVVSLASGWRRADFLAVLRPQGLFRVTIAVLVAFLVVWSVDILQGSKDGAWEGLRGLSRLPLYVVTLAYGPSAGLLAAGLFAAFATTTSWPGWSEAVLALELVVLGWFALAPSPRKARWAGPAGALSAYFLAWSTGGAALLQSASGAGAVLAAHLTYHQDGALGTVLSMALLFLVGPKMYDTVFPGSRIVPRPPSSNPNGGFTPERERRTARGGRRATDRLGAEPSPRRRRADLRAGSDLSPATVEPSPGEGPVDETRVKAGSDRPPLDASGLEQHADAELVAPGDGPAPSAAPPTLGDAPHDVES